jgi:hypothetical protein
MQTIITQTLGFNCFEHPNNVFEWVTPFTFFDGDTVTFFTEPVGNLTRFFDASFTVQHLDSVGIHMRSAKDFDPIKRLLKRHQNITLDDVGELSIIAANANKACDQYLRALLHIADWEATTANHPMVEQLLRFEAQAYLKQKSTQPIEQDIKITGMSGKQHTIHFAQGNDWVLLSKPTGDATGRTLRKMLDIKNTPAAQTHQTIVILDDTSDTNAAKGEADIISSVADSTIMLSTLIKQSGAAKH